MKEFFGYHSEWNLGSPGGWDYQRVTQIIGKAVWEKLGTFRPMPVRVDFDHPLLYPVNGLVDMLIGAHRTREGKSPGLIAVVAEEETLEDVTENINLAKHLSAVEGITGVLIPPEDLELRGRRVCWRGTPVSILFVDFNSDVLLSLHKKHDLSPLLEAVRQGRVINPRGTEPINVKSMFEVLTTDAADRFHEEVVARTPWTRRFLERKTTGPKGEPIEDLVRWTMEHWDRLVLKPERGYSGKGVRVGGIHPDAAGAVNEALQKGQYIVQEKIPLHLWAEEIPVLDREKGVVQLERVQTDFRCLVGPEGLMGFLGRFGGVPTNVGSGGGVQPLAILRSETTVRDAVGRVNEAILKMSPGDVLEAVEVQKEMALEHRFTYLLGPIKIALRPRLLGAGQVEALGHYCAALWRDCLTLESMWLAGELDEVVKIEADELEIARMQPWRGSPAIIASDGLFSFGANPE
ncbi:MAG: hypothetical protein GX443_11365 [Deltaproteobacteria bacterium]|nr:hypothetical protein [Deltaproteobacteria bacterium]